MLTISLATAAPATAPPIIGNIHQTAVKQDAATLGHWHNHATRVRSFIIIFSPLIPLTRRFTARTGHDAVKRSQVSSRNAAMKVIFCIERSQLFSSGHGYKLVDAGTVAFAHALNASFQGARQEQGVSGYIADQRLL